MRAPCAPPLIIWPNVAPFFPDFTENQKTALIFRKIPRLYLDHSIEKNTIWSKYWPIPFLKINIFSYKKKYLSFSSRHVLVRNYVAPFFPDFTENQKTALIFRKIPRLYLDHSIEKNTIWSKYWPIPFLKINIFSYKKKYLSFSSRHVLVRMGAIINGGARCIKIWSKKSRSLVSKMKIYFFFQNVVGLLAKFPQGNARL